MKDSEQAQRCDQLRDDVRLCDESRGKLALENERLRDERDYYIHQIIDLWHSSPPSGALHKALGWTKQQYGAWIESPKQYPEVTDA